MERIKQAIEDAKKTGVPQFNTNDAVYAKRSASQPQLAEKTFVISWSAVKYLTAAIVIFFAGWLWLRLDFMNQLELISSQNILDAIQFSRMDISRRVQSEEKFKQALEANRVHCLEAAEKDRANYMSLVKQGVISRNSNSHPAKNEKFVITQAAIKEADRLMEAAKAECQHVFESHLAQGH